MDATIYSKQFHSSVTAYLNSGLCTRFVVIVEKMRKLHEPYFNATIKYILYCIISISGGLSHYCTMCKLCSTFVVKLKTVLHESQFQIEVIKLYDLWFVQLT